MVVEITTTIMGSIKETMVGSMEVKETKDTNNMGTNKGSKEAINKGTTKEIKGTIKGVTKEVKINNMVTTKVIPNKGVAQRETTTLTTKGKPDMTMGFPSLWPINPTKSHNNKALLMNLVN